MKTITDIRELDSNGTCWNSIDSEEYHFKDHICAFLDILGYKEKSNLFYKGQLNLPGRIKRALEFSGVEDNREDSPDGIFTQIFSDSIIIHTTLDNIDFLLNYVASLSAYFSYEELYIRGGVSIGKFYEDYIPNNNYSFFSSEALIKAYEIEQNAIYPLIEIEEEIILQNKVPNNKILCKFNGKYILNYARYIINDKGSNIDVVFKEIESIVKIFNNTKEQKVRNKIQWIISYYLWFIEKIKNNNSIISFDFSQFSIFDKYKNQNFIFEEI